MKILKIIGFVIVALVVMLGIDSQLGPMYDQGLANLNTYVEGLPDPDPIPEVVEVADDEDSAEK